MRSDSGRHASSRACSVQRRNQLPGGPLGSGAEREASRCVRELIGSIQSRVPVEAASRVAARIAEIKVRAGDHVRRGQVIVMLDAAELKAQVAQAQGEAGRGAGAN